jgi:hypothetical protein
MKIVKHIEINSEFEVGKTVWFFNDSAYAECPYCDKTAKVMIKGREFDCPCCGVDDDEGYAHIGDLIDYKPKLVEGVVTAIELLDGEESVLMTVKTVEGSEIVMYGNVHDMDDNLYIGNDFTDNDRDWLSYICGVDKEVVEQGIEDFVKR